MIEVLIVKYRPSGRPGTAFCDTVCLHRQAIATWSDALEKKPQLNKIEHSRKDDQPETRF